MRIDPARRYLRDLGALFRVCRMYPGGNDQIVRASQRVVTALRAVARPVWVARVGGYLVLDDRTVAEPTSAEVALMAKVGEAGWEGVRFAPTLEANDLILWVRTLLESVADGAGRSVDGIEVGTLSLVSGGRAGGDGGGSPNGQVAELLPGVQDVLARLLRGDPAGMGAAREIVAAVAGGVASRGSVFDPVRQLKDHDAYTYTHALNVSVLSAALARAVGADTRVAESVGLAALCHDVGKEKIPRAVLNKAGALDPDEKALMDAHPVEGARMLLELGPGVDPLVPVVAYEHHRRLDGSGYPSCGGPIHPASQVVAVCDTFDALRTLRPYRGEVAPPGAVRVLVEEAFRGTLRADYVEAFLDLVGAPAPGWKVTLSNGTRGVVSEGGPSPLCPVVVTEDGGTLALVEHPDLRLVGFDEPGPGDPPSSDASPL